MEVIPAIDIRGGRCVRLYQGDYDRETVFADDPVAVAVRWAEMARAGSTSSTWTRRNRAGPRTCPWSVE